MSVLNKKQTSSVSVSYEGYEASGKFSENQLFMIKSAFEYHFPLEGIKLIANPELTLTEMMMTGNTINYGLTLEQSAIIANPNIGEGAKDTIFNYYFYKIDEVEASRTLDEYWISLNDIPPRIDKKVLFNNVIDYSEYDYYELLHINRAINLGFTPEQIDLLKYPGELKGKSGEIIRCFLEGLSVEETKAKLLNCFPSQTQRINTDLPQKYSRFSLNQFRS